METQQKRLTVMLRHCSQYFMKTPLPAWFAKLDVKGDQAGNSQEDGDGEEGGESEDEELDESDMEDTPDSAPIAKKPAAATTTTPTTPTAKPAAVEPIGTSPSGAQWSYSYDADLQKAFRRRRGARKSDPGEDSVEIRVPELAGPTDPMEAVWADGSTWQIPQTTVATWTSEGAPSQVQPPGAAAPSEIDKSKGYPSPGDRDTMATTPYKWIHPEDGKPVRVYARWNRPSDKQKKDRLICLQHMGQPQVVMVNIDLFKRHADDTDEMTEIRAWAWMVPIAEKFVRQEIDRDGCREEKMKLMPPKTDVKKRPAAAGTDAAAATTASPSADAAPSQAKPPPVAAAPSEIDKTKIIYESDNTETEKPDTDATEHPATPKKKKHKKDKNIGGEYRQISPPPASSPSD